MNTAYAPLEILQSDHIESKITPARIHVNIQFRKPLRIGTVSTKMLFRTYILLQKRWTENFM